jgi:predicted  nucleic acid-binding Zn-ribbon protein
MRKTVVIGMAIISVLLLGATAVSYTKYKKSQADYAKATADQDSTRLRYERAVGEIVAIQDSLNAITPGGETAQGDVELQAPGTLHDKVLARISTLKSSIERTKGRIEELDTRLKHSGVRIASLQKMINGLRQSAADKEERIAELSTQVGTLRTTVTGMTYEIQGQQEALAQREQELAEKQRELATIYYAMGTKKELASAGVVEKRGGVLGVGKSLKLSGMFEEAAFVPLNTDQENVIRIPTKKVQVLSAQPPSSYALQTVGKNMVELRILDRTEFRKIKHLVILKA